MNTETVKTTVGRLTAGDVLSGSGFVVTHTPYQTVGLRGTPKVVVEGFYPPTSQPTARAWNRNTTVTVIRSV